MKPITIFLLFILLAFNEARAQEHVKAGFGVTVVQQQPTFPGGEDSLMAFLKTNLRYPQEAKLAWIQGRVFVGFLIDNTGKIKDVRILSSVNPQLDDEALRVVHMMPDWIPGTVGGTNVDVQYILPIEFVMPKKTEGRN
jgi:TonB family protein